MKVGGRENNLPYGLRHACDCIIFPRSFRGRVGSSMVEQRPFKALVPGSSPGQPTSSGIPPRPTGHRPLVLWPGVRRHAEEGESAAKGLGAIEGAVFALLGLILAFTFSGALTRFDERRHLVV